MIVMDPDQIARFVRLNHSIGISLVGRLVSVPCFEFCCFVDVVGQGLSKFARQASIQADEHTVESTHKIMKDWPQERLAVTVVEILRSLLFHPDRLTASAFPFASDIPQAVLKFAAQVVRNLIMA